MRFYRKYYHFADDTELKGKGNEEVQIPREDQRKLFGMIELSQWPMSHAAFQRMLGKLSYIKLSRLGLLCSGLTHRRQS